MPRSARRAPATPAGLTFAELDDSRAGLAFLTDFYETLYVAEFPDPNERESLANMKRYLRLKARGFYGKNNYHILVAALDGRTVGGAVLDYLVRPNVGVIEFLFINARYRVQGLGKALLDETTRRLQEDARTRIGRPLAAIVAEMNDPYRRPDTPDNLDPFGRAMIWGKWGYTKIDFPYVQPALSRGQQPVECLVLIMRPLLARDRTLARGIEGRWVASIVGEYLRWAMRIPEFVANAQYRAMASFLRRAGRVPLIPLQTYVGRDPQRAFEAGPITPRHRAFESTLALIAREITTPGRVASAAQFKAAFARRRGCHYSLWALRAPGAARVDGAASFFALQEIGFGGYIVLARALRGKGLLRQLVARIEHQIMIDSPRAQAWFIECGAESAPAFTRVGFIDLPVHYRPPAVGMTDSRNTREPERLHLMYKPFGSAYSATPPARQVVLDGVAVILRQIYGIRAPRAHDCYRRLYAPAR